MENALESGEGFRQWAENNLPIDKYTGEKFPLGSTNLHFFELSNQEKTELNELVKDGKKPTIGEVYEALDKFFTRNKEEIETNFMELRVFGYPVILVMNKKYWPKSTASAHHNVNGYILLRGYDVDEKSLREDLVHELTHAIANYPDIDDSSKIWTEKTRELDRVSKNYYYTPEDLFNKDSQKAVGEVYKDRVLDMFRQEVESYYTCGEIRILKQIKQKQFNDILAQVEDFDRNPKEFESDLFEEYHFTNSLRGISLIEIQKHDPEFGKELDSTLRFWKMVLENSSPERIEKIIDFIQSASSFDQVSIRNLSFIYKSGIFAESL